MNNKETKRRKLTIFIADYKEKIINTIAYGPITYENYLLEVKKKMIEHGCDDIFIKEKGQKIKLYRYV